MQDRTWENLVELLIWRAACQPERRAYTFLADGETQEIHLTYGQLDQQARTIAAWLQSQGLTGKRALLLYPPGLEFISAFFGCLYAGVVAIPIYPPRPNRSISRVQAIAADSQAAVALTVTSLLDNLEHRLAGNSHFLAALNWLASDRLHSSLASDWQRPAIGWDDLAFLQYTSGSTGNPKGVMVSHGNLLCNCADLDRGWEHGPESILVSWLPTFHDMGLIYGVIQPLYKGFPGYLMAPVYFLQRPVRWLQAISRYGGTHSGAPNFAYELCLSKITPQQRDALDLSTWRMALNGAEPVRAETLERFAQFFQPCGFNLEAFCPGYGLAEATLKVTAVRRELRPTFYKIKSESLSQHRVVGATEFEENARTFVGCGWTEIDTQIAIVNPESFRQCNPDEVGEIWVSGSTLAQGYWRREQETEETFGAYLKDTGEGPFLRTGDLGFIKNGELFVTGRLKDVIIIRGRNYYPQDIELTVEKSNLALRPGFGAAFEVEVGGAAQLVIVQEIERSYLRKFNAVQVAEDIYQSLKSQYELQVYGIGFLKTGSIPKTSSGKIQRNSCRTKFLDGSLEVIEIVGKFPPNDAISKPVSSSVG